MPAFGKVVLALAVGLTIAYTAETRYAKKSGDVHVAYRVFGKRSLRPGCC